MFETAYAFVPQDHAHRDLNYRMGGTPMSTAYSDLAKLIKRLLLDPTYGCGSFVLEEVLVRRHDELLNPFGSNTRYLGDAVYATFDESADANAIEAALTSQYSYAGVCVLSDASNELWSRSVELSTEKLSRIVSGTRLLIVPAFDGDGHVIVPLQKDLSLIGR